MLARGRLLRSIYTRVGVSSQSVVLSKRTHRVELSRVPSRASGDAASRGLVDMAGTTTVPLVAAEDHYGGVIIDADKLPSCPVEFTSALKVSLEEWTRSGRRGIWLRIPTTHGALVGPATEQGFDFHSADRGYVLLTKWLPSGPCTLPLGASHAVGVGAIVANSKGEILVVLERSGPLKGTGTWKMPTGHTDPGEDLMDAVVREVKEETGLDCKPEGIIAVRQMHGIAQGKSDLFFVIGCRPVDEEQPITACPSELEAAKWMPLEEYASIEFMRSRPLYARLIDRCVAWAKGEVRAMPGDLLDGGFNRGPQRLFFL